MKARTVLYALALLVLAWYLLQRGKRTEIDQAPDTILEGLPNLQYAVEPILILDGPAPFGDAFDWNLSDCCGGGRIDAIIIEAEKPKRVEAGYRYIEQRVTPIEPVTYIPPPPPPSPPPPPPIVWTAPPRDEYWYEHSPRKKSVKIVRTSDGVDKDGVTIILPGKEYHYNPLKDKWP